MKIVALAGGVGGAKLADGLARAIRDDDHLTVIVNTGDDFTHCGLRISPDVDTVCYTLANLSNSQTGWGRSGETWNAFENLKKLGGPNWFSLGDQDLGTHLERTRQLLAGVPLSKITRDFCEVWGITSDVIPMSDDQVATMVETADFGWLSFQEYFVLYGCQPKVKRFRFEGISKASPAPGVIEAIRESNLVVVCPSNPFVSIAPIVALPGVRQALESKSSVVAVSPIVGGKAIKGPAAKMFTEFGKEPSALAVAVEYKDWVHGIVIDNVDTGLRVVIQELGLTVGIENTVMLSRDDRKDLAAKVIRFGLESKPL